MFKRNFLLIVFVCIIFVCRAQKESVVVMHSSGDVYAITNGQKTAVKGRIKLDAGASLQIGKMSSAVLVNSEGIPCKLDKEGVYPVKSMQPMFKSDPLTAKYFKYIWEEIEVGKTEKHSAKLTAVGASVRGEDMESPGMLCPYDSTIAVNDTLEFAWTDPMNKKSFYLFIIDYKDNQKILLKKHVNGTSIAVDRRALSLISAPLLSTTT